MNETLAAGVSADSSRGSKDKQRLSRGFRVDPKKTAVAAIVRDAAVDEHIAIAVEKCIARDADEFVNEVGNRREAAVVKPEVLVLRQAIFKELREARIPVELVLLP